MLLDTVDSHGGFMPDDLPCALDLEYTHSSVTASQVLDSITEWLELVWVATGKTPILYTYPAFWASLTRDVPEDRLRAFKHFPLWIAHYRSKSLGAWVPEPWERWDIWQYSGKSLVSGIPVICDTNIFEGGIDALHAFARGLPMTTRIVQEGCGGTRDIIVIYNLTSTWDFKILKAVGPKPMIVNVTGPAFTQYYSDTGHGKIEPLPELLGWAAERVGVKLGRVTLVGFSEGCQAIRTQLLEGHTPFACVAVDGIHGGYPATNFNREVKPWQDFIQLALNGNHVFCASHSGLTYVEQLPNPYASVHTMLQRITGWELSLPKDGTFVVTREGNVSVYSYGDGYGNPHRAAHVKQAREVLPFILAEELGPWLVEMQGTVVTEPAHAAPTVPLGERCVEWSMGHLGVKEDPLGSNSGPLIDAWREPAVRGYGEQAYRLNLPPCDWCGFLACAAVQACLAEGEAPPHGYRAGVVEIVEDTIDNRHPEYVGRWVPIGRVLIGEWQPRTGDLAVYDRSQPGRPDTSWWRHVNRVIEYDPTERQFTAIGGNETHEVRISEHSTLEDKLLGFVTYPQIEQQTPTLTDEERKAIEYSVQLCLMEAADAVARHA
jgi:hypothetical protein